MGGSASRVAVDAPFPIDSKVNSDLDLLSLVVARILNTPDVYDINNLARPGVCGDYAVLLKEQIEKKLLPFVAEIGKDTKRKVKVVYQNPTKLIKDFQDRKEICSQLADSAVRVVAIVMACLSSIQVSGQSRETAVASVLKQGKPLVPGAPAAIIPGIPRPVAPLSVAPLPTAPLAGQRYGQIGGQTGGQTGGGIQNIREWFATNGYISQEDSRQPAMTAIDLINPQRVNYSFKLKFGKTEANITHAELTAQTTDVENPMPGGSLKMQFVDPTTIPGTPNTMLPFRILDVTGIPWMVGILYKNVYKSLSPDIRQVSPFMAWHNLFRKSQPQHDVSLLETDRTKLDTANAVFEQVKQTGRYEPILQQLTAFLSEYTGYTPMAPYGQPYGQPYQPYGQPYGQPFGQPFPTYGQQGIFQPKPLLPFGPQPVTGVPKLGGELQAGIEYVIPMQATRGILTTLQNFRELFVTKSCPAAVRATTLSSQVNKDRSITTGACRDPYWVETNLSKVYPYATLQFLCIKDWKHMGERAATADIFSEPWRNFLTGLREVYGAKLSETGVTLDQISFKAPQPENLCRDTQTPRVGYQKVQSALLSIQGAYARHVAAIWKILNQLIMVIEDPETKTEIVRLHPKVTDAGKSSRDYVNDLANLAAETISKHYVEIERIYYVETVTQLKAL